MANTPQKPKAGKDKPIEVELEPNAWLRFESLIKQAAKVGPQPRKKAAKPKAKKKTPAK